MRIVHIITRLIIGGAQENTILTVLGLRKYTNWTVHLISGPTYGPEGSLEDMVNQQKDLLFIEPFLVRPINPIYDTIATIRLTAKLKQLHPTIVHTHSGKAGFLGRLAAKLANVPIVVHTIHGPSFGNFQGSLPNFIYKTAERIVGRWTTHFVVVANAMQELYLSAGIGRKEIYTRIFSGFDLSPYIQNYNKQVIRQTLNIPSNAIVIAKLARFFHLKGHEYLFKIAPELIKQIPNVHFLLIGDGILRDFYEKKAIELGIREKFSFVGLISPERIPTYLSAADMLVHLSIREGLARAIVQALALQIPVITWNCYGASEVCIDGESGFVVPTGDLILLKERIILLAQNPKLRAQMGKKGQEFVSKFFSQTEMISQIIELYKKLIKKTFQDD